MGTRIRDGVGHGCGCLKVPDRGSKHVRERPVCNQTTAMPGNSLLLSTPSELFLYVRGTRKEKLCACVTPADQCMDLEKWVENE